MDKNLLLRYIAPCSLCCYSCPALKDGAIAKCSQKLCQYYEGYYDFNDANIPNEYRGWLPELKKFTDTLVQNANASCPSCREQPETAKGCIPDCYVRNCYKIKGVDYCAECVEFPCEGALAFFKGINEIIGQDWINGNERIKKVGIDQYFDEKKDSSHYQSYKKNTL